MVSLVGLVKEFKNLNLTDYELAHLAYVTERLDLGILGGLQDQYAATFGGFNFMEFGKDQVIVNPLRIHQEVMNELEHNLLLCYTGTTRRSDQIIAHQKQKYTGNDAVAVAALRQQKQLAVEMKNLLLQRRLEDFGDLLHCAWESKKKLSSRISNPTIDEMYSEARKAGALGGKMTGAGGGGYMLFYCDFEKRHKVAAVLRKMGATPTDFAFDAKGLQTWKVPARRQSHGALNFPAQGQEAVWQPNTDCTQGILAT
jgi:D-glycero-alpha-D-manno-heptose-7-phosphate kinase